MVLGNDQKFKEELEKIKLSLSELNEIKKDVEKNKSEIFELRNEIKKDLENIKNEIEKIKKSLSSLVSLVELIVEKR